MNRAVGPGLFRRVEARRVRWLRRPLGRPVYVRAACDDTVTDHHVDGIRSGGFCVHRICGARDAAGGINIVLIHIVLIHIAVIHVALFGGQRRAGRRRRGLVFLFLLVFVVVLAAGRTVLLLVAIIVIVIIVVSLVVATTRIIITTICVVCFRERGRVEAILLFAVVHQMAPLAVRTQDIAVADDPQRIAGTCNGHVQALPLLQKPDASEGRPRDGARGG
mmetsp:Transcript_52859/g.92252  ORF Transcript_52859/g.92252 Transcript_52859/m.92252 type:complete len:220 (-) Transcript_52859:3438-4097(-)